MSKTPLPKWNSKNVTKVVQEIVADALADKKLRIKLRDPVEAKKEVAARIQKPATGWPSYVFTFHDDTAPENKFYISALIPDGTAPKPKVLSAKRGLPAAGDGDDDGATGGVPIVVFGTWRKP